mmetsp:Transcript_47763/g.136943  ORF Transcript_47763/g.136943 Transcript_47763/m.136943 type:complete len:339 (+) Transcript_47763:473-1489(+)
MTAAAPGLRLRAYRQGSVAEHLGVSELAQGRTSHAEVRQGEAELLMIWPEMHLLDLEASQQKLVHPLHVATLSARQRQIVESDGRLNVAGSEVPLLDLQAPLEQLKPLRNIAELAVDTSKVDKRRSRLHVALAIMLFLDLQAALQEHLLLAHIAQLTVGCGQIVQGNGRVDVPSAEVLLFDCQAPFKQLLLFLHVAHLAMCTCKLRGGYMAAPEVCLGNGQAFFEELLALANVAQLRVSLRQVAQGMGNLGCSRAMVFDHASPGELGQLAQGPALVGLLARRAPEIVPICLSDEVLHQAIQVHILRGAAARTGVHEVVRNRLGIRLGTAFRSTALLPI